MTLRGMIAACLLAVLLLVPPARAQDFYPANYFVDIHQGSELSDQAAELADGGYELSDGTWVSFAEWYHTDWQDIRFEMMTQFTPDFGLLWGGSTGERGEKYTIDPSISLGFVAQVRTGPSSALSMTFRTIFAGELTEKTCEADYGDIGGIQTVNCRLAASILAPEETLEYLVNADPNRLHIALTYSVTF